jgi:hypothetical protein
MQTLLVDVKDNTAPTSIKVAETSFGKDISISRGKNGQMFVITVAGGGTKPLELDGHFTGWKAAEDAIKGYVDSGNGRYATAENVKLSEQKPGDIKPTLTKRPKISMQAPPETITEPEVAAVVSTSTPDFMAPASE